MSRVVRAVLSRLSVAVALVLLAPPECALADNSDSADASGRGVIEEILSTWEARASSIQSLRIRARFFRRGSDLRPLSPDQVMECTGRYGELGNAKEETAFLLEHLLRWMRIAACLTRHSPCLRRPGREWLMPGSADPACTQLNGMGKT